MNVLQLLYEAADLSSGEKILKAFEKGMVPGVKKKVFFADAHTKRAINFFDKIQKAFSARIPANNLNAALFMLFKKAGTLRTLETRFHALDTYDEWIDAFVLLYRLTNCMFR